MDGADGRRRPAALHADQRARATLPQRARGRGRIRDGEPWRPRRRVPLPPLLPDSNSKEALAHEEEAAPSPRRGEGWGEGDERRMPSYLDSSRGRTVSTITTAATTHNPAAIRNISRYSRRNASATSAARCLMRARRSGSVSTGVPRI